VIIRLSAFSQANGATPQRDGKIVVVAHSLEAEAEAVVRLNLNGSLDQTFGANGIQELRVRDLTLFYGVEGSQQWQGVRGREPESRSGNWFIAGGG
jgi:hypothetical protein